MGAVPHEGAGDSAEGKGGKGRGFGGNMPRKSEDASKLCGAHAFWAPQTKGRITLCRAKTLVPDGRPHLLYKILGILMCELTQGKGLIKLRWSRKNSVHLEHAHVFVVVLHVYLAIGPHKGRVEKLFGNNV